MGEATGPSSGQPTLSATDWGEWVAELIDKHKQTFIINPAWMVGAYNRERASTDDYRGRELLELLQNADDAGEGSGPNRVLIRHWPEGVCVANTGIPFSKGGVKSLMVDHCSPKKLARCRQIGNRGLGIRSILSWTRSPLILSGALRLVFSDSHARETLDRLCADDGDLRKTVEEWRAEGYRSPIPILACPSIVDDEAEAKERVGEENFASTLPRAVELREEYDTVIAIPFTERGSEDDALSQVGALDMAVMLFLEHVQELIVETEGTRSVWRADRTAGAVTIVQESEEAEPTTWRVFRRDGIVPKEVLPPEEHERPAFEIRIAVPEDNETPGTLFNYFPTEVRFPYTVVAHVTLELTSNRQNLTHCESNRFLVKKLAQALADAAEACATPDRPWAGVELLTTKDRSCDPVLEKLGFPAALPDAARTKRLVPTRDDRHTQASEAKRIPVDAEGWLPKEEFGDLCLWPDDHRLRQTLEWLEVPELTGSEFAERVERLAPHLTVQERAALIGGLVDHKQKDFLRYATPPASLLIDDQGHALNVTDTIYLPPTTSMAYQPPDWMPLRFLSTELLEALMVSRKCSRDRLVEELHRAGYSQVHAYDFAGIASAIAACINRRCEEQPDNEDAIRREGLHALRDLLDGMPGSSRPGPGQGPAVKLPTRKGEWQRADQLYVGAPYDGGEIVEALLGTVCPEQFVADPTSFGGQRDAADWAPLLIWLGADRHPREERWFELANTEAREYFEWVLLESKRPLVFGHEPFEVHVRGDYKSLDSVQVTTLDRLKEMIDKADPHAILAWLATDERFNEWSRGRDTGVTIQATFRSHTERTCRNDRLPSYILWFLRETEWLPDAKGNRHRPSHCVLARTTGELDAILPRPAIDPEHALFQKLQITQSDLFAAMTKIGVCTDLDALPWHRCYELMLSLPKEDPAGKAATRLYRVLANKTGPHNANPALEARMETFKQSGKLWAYQDGQGRYVPVRNGVYFVADQGIPEPATSSLPVVDLPKVLSDEKAERLFGVKVLRRKDVTLTVADHQAVPNSNAFQQEVRALKPYVLALRLDATTTVTGLRAFKKLEILPCSSVKARAQVEEKKLDLDLSTEGHSVVHEDQAYLVVSSSERAPTLKGNTLLAYYVGHVLAGVLQVEQASHFAQLACETDPETRKKLLANILGYDCSKLLAEAKQNLNLEDDDPEAWHLPVPRPAAPPTPTAGGEGEPSQPGEAPSPHQTPASPDPTAPPRVTATETPQAPTEPRPTVARRVRTKQSSTPPTAGARRITDGDLCEQIAERFEESQGRFPLPVAHIQGDEGYGCDLLSFGSAEDCEHFKAKPEQALELVQRFIEVKGRSSERGSIPLAGNEQKAAKRFGQRYHLYRVHETDSGRRWQLVELDDPLNAMDWDVTYDIDPFRCDSTRYWDVEADDAEGR